jgi:predicted O-methyltransferase YrrM
MKKSIKRLLKTQLKLKDHQDFYKEFISLRKKQEKQIPKIDLDQIHIQQLKVLIDRNALLDMMPLNSICAEIGVNEGEFSQRILEKTNPAKLHLIDAWGNASRYHDGLKNVVEARFSKEITSGKVIINIGYSTDVLTEFPDHHFDWVYLDTDHTYELTSKELAILKDKVKPGGIIAGHDYILGNWVGDYRYGVIEAVHELCVKEGWQLKYITINRNESPSFAITKIGQ